RCVELTYLWPAMYCTWRRLFAFSQWAITLLRNCAALMTRGLSWRSCLIMPCIRLLILVGLAGCFLLSMSKGPVLNLLACIYSPSRVTCRADKGSHRS